jgi:bifunctional non-homologous end joining protein LigD
MALEEYKKKRNFSSTPEPSGDTDVVERRKQSRGELFFCVQKHLASHLHYDLRLEWNGVLLSWAVPKGPSIDPGDKRLAMHVEDHPIEYGTFEGVIPEGYGAGIVMLWDRGTWEPESDDVDAALKKGDLKFRLDGFKLKGSWVLVRTGGYGRSSSGRGSGDGRSWLLIKHRDDWAGPLDITTFAPLSVKTPDADLADILASGNPDIWRSHAPAKGGDTGAMFQRIIEQALEIKQSNTKTKAPKAAPASAAKAASARSRRSSQGDRAASEGGKAPKEGQEAKEPKGTKEKNGVPASAATPRPAVKKAKAAKAPRTSAKPPARRSKR